MNHHFDPTYEMGLQDFFTWRSQTVATATPADEDEELPADVDEPPDHRLKRGPAHPDFHKSIVRPQNERSESLLTKAFQKGPEPDTPQSDIRVATDLTRRRSMMSNASLASTAELTSDGGLTSPARTNTPSPPIPGSTYTSFAPYSFTSKPVLPTTLVAKADSVEPVRSEVIGVSPKAQPAVETVVKKRCITFMCDGKKGIDSKPKPAVLAVSQPAPITEKTPTEAPQPRKCTIKFACTGPKPSEKACKAVATDVPQRQKPAETQKSVTARSPSIPRKSPKPALSSSKSNTSRRTSHSPVAVRAKPKYIIADEKTLQLSEATRFHEFASEELQDDDWIRKDADIPRDRKLTINDTLKMENAIRALGNEAEEEALEDEEDDDEEDQVDNDSDENDSDDEDVEDDEDEFDDVEIGIDSSEDEGSDGNETDNEAGFAESDDESDGEGEFSFWTLGRKIHHHGQASIYRPSAHRTASTSSIDSLNHMEPTVKKRRSRAMPMKLRPGTPELPDSTDFVCGTLDEDRPLEDAYVSCIAAKNAAKHKRTPQDIDPSFPTSDIEDEEDENDDIEDANGSDEQVWLHGKFEESDNERYGRRRSTTMRRKSPGHSPRRLHSPPPKQTRHRSPPPRKLFGHSPRRLRSPPPPRHVRSPQASPTSTRAIPFAVLASRPGLTHTKSLPRTPNAFCRQYNASRLAAANGNNMDAGDNDGFQRGAIDIVKGLEQKRQRRKEKLYQKECNRKKKGHGERRPQPGKGAERMRELGLLMAGKTGPRDDPYMLSA
ncbi:uncharacterized protein PAC_16114 [Phialocephala subalpina]|uniref:Extensin domain-containing protein n=1 Tax=Phialocephala subalpina TaxID=576137 RepID=A0A1L7XMG2_9HELO|nr:uncharacterized protein PAC_16114 [Phialocephala subalpina]